MERGRDVASALGDLREAVEQSRFDLDDERAGAARLDRAALLHQIDDYLLPRLRSLDAPLLVVVGGSTGAGKSTLVNSLVGQDVTTAGVLRPTTRAPVLACNPLDRHWFSDDRVLPGLARTTGAEAGAAGAGGTVQLVGTDGLPPGLALLDAPDIDSVVSANRELAGQLLAAADLWLFVTTAARYADAVPWALLSSAQERRAEVAIVLDRVPPEGGEEVEADLVRMLRERGLDPTRVHSIPETVLVAGRLAEQDVAPLRLWLRTLAGDAEARARVIRSTLEGALASMERRVEGLVLAGEAQSAAARELRRQVDDAYEAAAREVDDAVRGGTLLRGEVLARWQEFVGTGELMRSMQARIGAFRDRLFATVTGRPSPTAGVQQAVESGIEALIHSAADEGAERAVLRWRQSAAGRGLTGGRARELSRASSELHDRLPEEVRAWQGRVLELVGEQGADKRTSARIASYTLNGAGLAVMLAVFAQTGGLTGVELAVAGGTSAASQKVIEAVFGDQAVRELARDARLDLGSRVEVLLDGEAGRFYALVDAAVTPPGPVRSPQDAVPAENAEDAPDAAIGARDLRRALKEWRAASRTDRW